MEIEKARELGLCFGVKRAIKMLKEAAGQYGKIEILGPVAHNQQLVEELAKVGIKPVAKLEQVQGKILAIPTHGVSPMVLSKIEARHIHIIDTTCPVVGKAQNAAKELAEAGFDVIVFGEAEHPEVKGLLGWAKGKGIAALNGKQIAISSLSLSLKRSNRYRLGVISQTTQSWPAFVEFTRQLIAILPSVSYERSPDSEPFPSRHSERSEEPRDAQGKLREGEGTAKQSPAEIRIVNTLCQATQRRQEAAVRLAKRSQLMIVIGGHNSANTRRLAEACSPIVETHMVERASEVDSSWLVGKHHIGVTAGASTPDEAIEEVIIKLKSL